MRKYIIIAASMFLYLGTSATYPALESSMTQTMERHGTTHSRWRWTMQKTTIKPFINPVLLGRMVKGMVKIKHGIWYDCGKKLTSEEQRNMALRIAYKILKRKTDFSPWGVLGTMFNESGFDSCALGVGPREWAYSQGMLKRKKKSISHSYPEVLNFVTSRRAKNKYSLSGFDLGVCQLLSRFYPAKEMNLLTISDGIDLCIDEMSFRCTRHKTNRPWLYWRSSSRTDWYRNKVKRWARAMGATRKELREL